MSISDHGLWVTMYEPLLGTVVELRIRARDAEVAEEADRQIEGEIRRLEHVFSAYDPSSELCRWRRGELDGCTTADFEELLRMALRWQVASDGAFNPAAGVMSAAWSQAADADTVPDPAVLEALADSIRSPAYGFEGGRLHRNRDCSTLTFNAIAKGYIVDRAVGTCTELDGVESIVVNAGGDLLHRGAGAVSIGIENPDTPFDNAAPLTVVDINNGGLATSGSARRGVRVGGRWHSHVIDPRTGQPVHHIRSASVTAPDAATADAVATVVGVLRAQEGIEFVEELADISCCLVDGHGQVWCSAGWARHERVR
jgi:thiamine biosynthesis lipoprotein